MSSTDPSHSGRAGSVILLHGIWALPVMMEGMARALRGHGYATLNPLYRSRAHAIDRIVDGLHPRFERFAREAEGPVHFVTHSMGSLVLRAYVARHRPSWLGRAVMLAPPNDGSAWVDLMRGLRLSGLVLGPSADLLAPRRTPAMRAALGDVDFPLGVIAGTRPLMAFASDPIFREPNDGKVAVRATHVGGQTDHITVSASHVWISRHRETIRQTIAFLADGRFAKRPPAVP